MIKILIKSLNNPVTNKQARDILRIVVLDLRSQSTNLVDNFTDFHFF